MWSGNQFAVLVIFVHLFSRLKGRIQNFRKHYEVWWSHMPQSYSLVPPAEVRWLQKKWHAMTRKHNCWWPCALAAPEATIHRRLASGRRNEAGRKRSRECQGKVGMWNPRRPIEGCFPWGKGMKMPPHHKNCIHPLAWGGIQEDWANIQLKCWKTIAPRWLIGWKSDRSNRRKLTVRD